MKDLKNKREVKNMLHNGIGIENRDNNSSNIEFYNLYKPKHIKRHPYHIVSASIAPIMSSVPLAYMVLYYFNVIQSTIGFWIAVTIFISGIVIWAFCIVMDSLYEQQHTHEVKRGLIIGMLLFIFSEVMFFFSFFWSYFYISLSPTIAIGCVWPPHGLTVYSYLGIPLLNTIVLLLSGIFLTEGYTILTERKSILLINNKIYNALTNTFNSAMIDVYDIYKTLKITKESQNDISYILNIINNNLILRNKLIKKMLFMTLICAAVFLFCQGYEYVNAPFSMNDGIYGSLFFLLTGFHGFHVLVGSILISIITIRFLLGNFEIVNKNNLNFTIFKNKSTGFACTLFYWHFVDVVWIFLYIVIYWWS